MASELAGAPRSDRRRWWLGLVVIGLLAWFGYSSFNQSLATYTHDFNVVRSRPGALLQVPGVIDKTAAQRYDTTGGTFEFGILDVTARTDKLTVRAHTVKPSNFDQANQVVCVGTYQNGVFDARQLLVKCPSKEQQKLSGAGGGS